MLSCEGNAGERWKTTIGLISKKTTLHVQHTFLYISLPLFCTTTTWNFHKLLSYTLYGGNVVRVLAHFFCIAAHFHLGLVAASILIFSPQLQNCHVVLVTKKMSPLLIISRCRSLSPLFSLSFAGMPPTFSFSVSFSSSIFQIFGNDNSINLSF